MVNTLSTLAVLASVSSMAYSYTSPTINTPTSLIVCEPSAITWTGGTEPYYITVIPAGEPSETPYESFPTQTGTSYTWTVDIAAGLNVSLALKDSTGTSVYSSNVVIQAGSSTSCVNSTSSAATSSTTAASGSSSSAASGTTTSAAASTSAASSGTSSAAASSTSTTTSGAAKIAAGSVVGLLGLLALAL
ncbi:hypothetical protein MNV49_003437 [Pseudohyphozyma bogoriensis]|nr:hypothetical protein MNV49_003437 [Pseudohyphozyma bogoriensis]